jgi:hypothetical protein
MKKFSKILFLALAFSALAAVKSYAQIEVSIRPEIPHAYVIARRPPPPSERHVWVEGEWREAGGNYVYVPGYWSIPPAGFNVWVPGHWRVKRNGRQIWVRGHWA